MYNGADERTDRRIHVTWLVSDPTAFERNPGPTSPQDVRISFGLTYREWRELFFVVLQVDPEQLALSAQTGRPIMDFDKQIPGFPMLSRINDVYADAIFSPEETLLLERETTRLLSQIHNPLASRGLEKLLETCTEARKLNLSIFMMSD